MAAAYFGVLALDWHLAPRAGILAAPMMAATCVLAFLGAVSTHNAIHCPVFHVRWMNSLWQVVLSLTYGHPVSSYHPGHNMSHHKYTESRKDLMRTTKARHRWNLLNLLLFMPSISASILTAEFRYVRATLSRRPRWARQFLFESAVFVAWCAVLIALDWRKALVWLVIPHQFAAWGIMTMNLLQHDGCAPGTPYNHSRNFVGRLINWWTFNNGFHTIHHMRPGMHWSLTPAAHAQLVAPHIHPNLDQPSMATYIWRTYFWPGQRLRFDGTLVEPQDPGPDERWFEAQATG